MAAAANQPASPGAGVAADPDLLERELEGLGLSPYEARVMLALLRLGAGTCAELARVAEVPRTSTYQIIEELQAKGLAWRLPGTGAAVWSSSERDVVLGRLDAIQEERLRQHRARTERVRELLAEAFPVEPSERLPFVHLVHDPSRVKSMYEQLVKDTETELLVFNKPPYSWKLGTPNQLVMETARRVNTRVLYEETFVNEPERQAWRQEMAAYHEAGARARMVDDIPVKLAVFDRKVALLTLSDPVRPNVGFPTVLLAEHPGFATVQADAFDRRWDTAREYEVHVDDAQAREADDRATRTG